MTKNRSRAEVADVLGGYITAQCDVVLTLGPRLEEALETPAETGKAQPTPDDIHDVRVAYRRLRSTLRTFAPVFSAPEATRLGADAAWFATRLGAVRDLDVLGGRVSAAMAALDPDLVLHDADRELATQLGYRRGIAQSELRDALHSETYADLIDQVREWQQRPPWAADADEPAERLRKAVKKADRRLAKRLHRAAEAVAAEDPAAEELIHSARKAAKRHRYAVEAVATVIGSRADKMLAARKELQDHLGDYQDSRLAGVLLRELGGIPGRNGFTFGLLYAQEAEHRRQLRITL